MAKQATAKAVLTLNDIAFVRGMKRAMDMANALGKQFANSPIKTTFLAFAKGAEKAVSSIGRVAGAFGKFALLATGVGVGVLAVESLAGAFRGLAAGVIDGAAQMETFQTGFKVFLGSAAAAKQHMAELSEFSAHTPFQIPEIAAASQQLQVMTQGLLDNRKGWRLVGDVAAGTGRRFQDVADSVGRLFTGLRSGSEVGDVLRSLQDMGALSPRAVRQIHGLAGSDASRAWDVATEALGRFSGQMEQKSHTWEGLMSTFRDNVNLAMAAFGTPLIEALKPQLKEMIMVIDSLRPKLEAIGKSFSGFLVKGINFIENALTNPEQLLSALSLTFSAIGNSFVKILSDGITKVGMQFASSFPGLAKMAGFNPSIAPSKPDTGPDDWQKAAAAWKQLQKPQGGILGLLPNSDLSIHAQRPDLRARPSVALAPIGSPADNPFGGEFFNNHKIHRQMDEAAQHFKTVTSPFQESLKRTATVGLSGMGLGDKSDLSNINNRAQRTVQSLVPLRERRQSEKMKRASAIAEHYLATGVFGMGGAAHAISSGDNKLARKLIQERQKGSLEQDVADIKSDIHEAWFGKGGGK